MAETTVQIKLDDNALREATTQAIAGMLTPEVREKLIEGAIRTLLQPDTRYGYSDKRTPLEIAFQNAVEELARQICKEVVAEDIEIKAKLQDLMQATMTKIFAADLDNMAERMADAFVSSMRGN